MPLSIVCTPYIDHSPTNQTCIRASALEETRTYCLQNSSNENAASVSTRVWSIPGVDNVIAEALDRQNSLIAFFPTISLTYPYVVC